MKDSICFQNLAWLGPNEYANRIIVCAANKYTLKDGSVLIIPCVRHQGPVLRSQLEVLMNAGVLDKPFCKPDDQGFIDQYNNWWSREDAYIIAKFNDQIDHDRNGHDHELFSEGLY